MLLNALLIYPDADLDFFENLYHIFLSIIALNFFNLFYKVYYLLLIFLVLSPLISILFLILISPIQLNFLRFISFFLSFIIFIFSIFFYILFEQYNLNFQFKFLYFKYFNNLNINYILGIDGISLIFVLLTTFLIPLCILVSWENIKYRLKEFLILLFLIEFFLINIFCILDLLLFYIFFESVLIPMFIIIGIWGSRIQKIYAAFQFFLYTLFGSVFMLIGIVYIYFYLGSTDLFLLQEVVFTKKIEILLWLSFFFSFAIKIPMFPVHIWLPEAHVEAPTSGSILLAGILLKLGGYGFLRFLIPLFPIATNFFIPFVFTLSLISIIYTSCTTLRQIDLKKIIAYSSIAHMNFVVIGLFSLKLLSFTGAILLMLNHGIVSSGLFFCIGLLYDRYHTRIIQYYGSIFVIMPKYALVFFFFILANISFPGTGSFISELFILIGSFLANKHIVVFMCFSIIFSTSYSFWLYNRLFFGQFRFNNLTLFSDLNNRELLISIVLIILILFLGLYPNFFLNILERSVIKLLIL